MGRNLNLGGPTVPGNSYQAMMEESLFGCSADPFENITLDVGNHKGIFAQLSMAL